ncbi:MAG TPA: hypothetical protein VFU81_03785 [Thermomicrobiales bacterium]|nr:hypothetical protein [Thermomicrobiales bacterium]
METWNLYMDDVPLTGDLDGDGAIEVEFRVVANSADEGDPEKDAVLAGLDLVDLINLRDALQQEIDNYALGAFEAQISEGGDGDGDDEILP